MEVGPHTVEQADHRSIDVPDFIRPRRTNADLRLLRMNAPARTTPTVLTNEPVPRGGRSEHLAKALSEKRERPRRDVAKLIRSHQLFDRPDLGQGELMRSDPRAGLEVIQTASLLGPFPSMVATSGKPYETKHHPEGKDVSRTLDCSQEYVLLVAVRESATGEAES